MTVCCQQANEDELTARHGHLQDVLSAGDDLIKAGNFGAAQIQERTDDINQQWQTLMDLSAYRRKRLNEAVDFYQVNAGVTVARSHYSIELLLEAVL